MAGVLEIEPTEGSTPQPAPVIQAPPLGAFSGAALGEGLSAIGKEIFATGMGAYHMAAEATAQAAETQFQTNAAKILEKYKTQYGWSAVQSHPQVTQELAQARQSALESLPSKLGRQYFNNSTLRIHRYAQESADAHFEQQNKNFQFKEYQGKQVRTIDNIRQFPLHADEFVKQAEHDARSFFESHGASPDQVEAEVLKSLAAASANALKTMAEYGNKDLLGAALDKWGASVTPQALGVAQKAYARSFAAKVVANLPRIDADRKRDDRGFVPYESVVAAIATISDDAPARDVTVEAIWKGFHESKARFDAAGAELEDVVDRQGQGRGVGGTWGKPEGSKDWEDFQRLYPKRAKIMEGKAERVLRSDLKRSIQSARGSALEAFEQMDPEAQKTQTYAQVASLVRTYEPHAGGEDIDKVWKRVEQIKTNKGDAVSQHMSNIVKKSMRGAFGKDEQVAMRYAGMARDYAEDLHASNPAMKEEEIISATAKAAPNWVEGLFSKGSPYKKAPRAAPQAAQEPDYEWDGKNLIPRKK